MEALQAAHFGWLSLLPPIIAIFLALLTKEVLVSLLAGILAGSLFYSGFHPVKMLETAFSVMGNKMGDNSNILIFLGLLGAIVVVVTKAGGSQAYGRWASSKIKSRRAASLATAGLGCLIFIDDYFNCLTVGTVMRPVTDNVRISREKLAYLLDAAAAPVCILAPVSSWGASVASYMQEAGAGNGMSAFLRTIPFNLYAVCTIAMLLLVCAVPIGFGPMARSEKKAAGDGRPPDFPGEVPGSHDLPAVREAGKVTDLVLPIAVLILSTLLAMLYTGGLFDGKGFFAAIGNTNASLSLVLGGFSTLLFALLFFLPRKVMKLGEFMEAVADGVKSMVPAYLILILAWTIGGICDREYLNTGGFIGGLINNSAFPFWLLPALLFVIAGFLGFATGTSWGTMAILIPIGTSVCSSSAQDMLFPVLGAVLAGSVFGDHISPISDTTILSSAGAGCDHIRHVSTQLPYATLVAAACLAGFLLSGFLKSAWIPLLLSLFLTLGGAFLLSHLWNRKYPPGISGRPPRQ